MNNNENSETKIRKRLLFWKWYGGEHNTVLKEKENFLLQQ